MKSHFVLFFTLFVLSLSSCTSQKVDAEIIDEVYPSPISTSHTVQESDQVSGFSYPQYNDGDEITWSIAVNMLLNGEVRKVTTYDDLKVLFLLRDGRALIAVQPTENEISRMISQCGQPCEDVEVSNE